MSQRPNDQRTRDAVPELIHPQTPIHVIGLGVELDDGQARLGDKARAALETADWVLGSERQLALVSQSLGDSQTQVLPKLNALEGWLNTKLDQRVVVLASGDPLLYGIGRWLLNRVNRDRLCFYPGVSSIQAACHSVGVAWQDVEVVSLHGRPLASIRARLRNQRYYAVLTDSVSTPQAIAQQCLGAGFDESLLWVCERLGYDDECVRLFEADALVNHDLTDNDALEFDLLNVVVLRTGGKGGVLPEFPGIDNAHFITDGVAGQGLISKREVRLAILSLLQPQADDLGWDIGAGCGGVTVEWARWNPFGQVIAIEKNSQRFECLQANVEKFGVLANTQLVHAQAPEVLPDLAAPSVIFIGGSSGELKELLRYCWQQLPAGGRLVASAVTEDSKAQLHDFADQLEAGQLEVDQSEQGLSEQGRSQTPDEPAVVIESMQIAVSRGGTLAGQRVYRPQLPVTLIKYTKPLRQGLLERDYES